MIAAVRALVAELHGPVGDDDRLDLESLTLVLLMEAMEDRWGVKLSVSDLVPEHFESVRAIAHLVELRAP